MCSRWNLRRDNQFQPRFYFACAYSLTLGWNEFKLTKSFINSFWVCCLKNESLSPIPFYFSLRRAPHSAWLATPVYARSLIGSSLGSIWWYLGNALNNLKGSSILNQIYYFFMFYSTMFSVVRYHDHWFFYSLCDQMTPHVLDYIFIAYFCPTSVAYFTLNYNRLHCMWKHNVK